MQVPPCVPAARRYNICFLSLSAAAGLLIREALRGSGDFLVFVQCSFFPLDIMLFLGFWFFFFFCKCFVAHKPHFPFECLCEHQSIHYAPSSALCVRRCVLGVCGGSRCGCPISVALHETEEKCVPSINFVSCFFSICSHLSQKIVFVKENSQRHSQNTKTTKNRK